jgi:UDP-2,4-diacetamido-2,4,6-trideoxy-beta-L-altropyranose hydrolase
MNIAIRVDSSLEIGTGHVMRTLTLAKALQKKGANVLFISRLHDGNIVEIVENSGFEVFKLSKPKIENEEFLDSLPHSQWLGCSQEEDAKECELILKVFRPDWLIVDHYAIDKFWQEKLKPFFNKLMIIDDLGDREHVCDLLLDQNYGATRDKYINLVPEHCQLLLGAKFLLLREEFLQWRNYSLKRRKSSFKLSHILVTLGGVDPDNYTSKVLQELSKVSFSSEVEVTVVLGKTAPHLKLIRQQASQMSVKTNLKINVSNMAEIMANSDLAIGAAGSTTWERCCLGLPSIQVVIANNQQLIAEALDELGAVKFLREIEQLSDMVKKAKNWMSEVHIACRDVVLGDGVNITLDKMEQIR